MNRTIVAQGQPNGLAGFARVWFADDVIFWHRAGIAESGLVVRTVAKRLVRGMTAAAQPKSGLFWKSRAVCCDDLGVALDLQRAVSLRLNAR